jgi:hypothetical protein
VRPAFKIALACVALTVPLTWLWVEGLEDLYARGFAWLAAPLLEPFGAAGGVAESPARKRFVSYLPFLVLVLVTPGLSARRRLLGLLAGIALIFLCHVGLVAVEALAQTRARPTRDAFSTVLPAALFADALPFILWAVIAQDVLRARFRRRAAGSAG